jgi:hypothetical protein
MPETTDGFATVGDMGWLDEDGYPCSAVATARL